MHFGKQIVAAIFMTVLTVTFFFFFVRCLLEVIGERTGSVRMTAKGRDIQFFFFFFFLTVNILYIFFILM